MKDDTDRRRRDRERKKKADYRQRQSDDIKVYPVPLPDDELVTLIDLQWVSEKESRNRKTVGLAIAAMLKTLKRK